MSRRVSQLKLHRGTKKGRNPAKTYEETIGKGRMPPVERPFKSCVKRRLRKNDFGLGKGKSLEKKKKGRGEEERGLRTVGSRQTVQKIGDQENSSGERTRDSTTKFRG